MKPKKPTVKKQPRLLIRATADHNRLMLQNCAHHRMFDYGDNKPYWYSYDLGCDCRRCTRPPCDGCAEARVTYMRHRETPTGMGRFYFCAQCIERLAARPATGGL